MFERIYDNLNCLDILFHKATAISPLPYPRSALFTVFTEECSLPWQKFIH